jgi:hypothetical protein
LRKSVRAKSGKGNGTKAIIVFTAMISMCLLVAAGFAVVLVASGVNL